MSSSPDKSFDTFPRQPSDGVESLDISTGLPIDHDMSISPELLRQREQYMRIVEKNQPFQVMEGNEADMQLNLGLKQLDDTNQVRQLGEFYIVIRNEKGGRLIQSVLQDVSMGKMVKLAYYRQHKNLSDKEYAAGRDPVLLSSRDASGKILMTIEDFRKIKYLERLETERNRLIRVRTAAFYDDNAAEDGLSGKMKDEKKEIFYNGVEEYIKQYGDELVELDSFPKEKQAVRRHLLLLQFKLLLDKNGFKDLKKEQGENLFDEIIGDLKYEQAKKEEYDITVSAMDKAVEEGITDEEEFEKRRQQALLDEAAKKKEAPVESPSLAVSAGTSVGNAPEKSYGNINEIAKDSWVHFDPVDPVRSPNLYTVRFNFDKTFLPQLKVVYDPADPKKDINNASFILEDPWADKESPNKGNPFSDSSSMKFKAVDMVGGINTLILDYVMNKKLLVKMPEASKEGPNDIITDAVMVRFARRIFPDGVKKPLTDERIKLFERLMTVVLKDNPPNYDTLLSRVDKMSRLLERDDLLGYVQGIFRNEASGMWTMDMLVKEIDRRSSGKISESK